MTDTTPTNGARQEVPTPAVRLDAVTDGIGISLPVLRLSQDDLREAFAALALMRRQWEAFAREVLDTLRACWQAIVRHIRRHAALYWATLPRPLRRVLIGRSPMGTWRRPHHATPAPMPGAADYRRRTRHRARRHRGRRRR